MRSPAGSWGALQCGYLSYYGRGRSLDVSEPARAVQGVEIAALPEGLCRCHRSDVGCVGVQLDANPEGPGVPIVLEPRPLPFQLALIGPLPIPL